MVTSVQDLTVEEQQAYIIPVQAEAAAQTEIRQVGKIATRAVTALKAYRDGPRSCAAQSPAPLECLAALCGIAEWHQQQKLLRQTCWPARLLDELEDSIAEGGRIALYLGILEKEQPSSTSPHAAEEEGESTQAQHEVGMLSAMRAGISFFGSPAICALADRTGRQQQFLYALLVLYAIARPSVLTAGSVLGVATLEALASIFEVPINSLVDSAVRHSFGAGGYGRQRMWGALGIGLASLIGGYVYDAGGGSYRDMMLAFVTVTMIALVAATRVPIGKRVELVAFQDPDGPSKEHGGGNDYGATQEPKIEIGETEDGSDGEASYRAFVNANGSINTVSQNKSADAKVSSNGINENRETATFTTIQGQKGGTPSTVWAVISTARTASFFSAVVLSGMGAGVIDTFLFIRLAELGGSRTMFGVSRLIMCLTELPFFYVSGPLIKRLGTRGAAALAQVAYLTRFLYYSVLTEPWFVLPAEMLHGLTFATMWAATIEYAHGIAPAGQEASIVGIVSGLHFGLGTGLGALLGGVLYVALGASLCFRVCAALPCLSLSLLAFPAAQRWFKYGGNGGRRLC